jgi:PAS domain S-box-containing protein
MFWETNTKDKILKMKNFEDLVSHNFAKRAIRSLESAENAISQIKEYQDKLEDSKLFWEATFNSVESCMAVLDKEGRILVANKSLINTVKMDINTLIGKSICEVFCEETACKLKAADNACITKCDKKHLKNSDRIYEVYVNPIIDEYLGHLYGCIFVAKDVTDTIKIADALQIAETKYRTVFEKSPIGIMILDPETGIALEFNDMACNQLGYTRDEFIKLRISDYEANESLDQIQLHIKKILDIGYDVFHTKHRTKNGIIKEFIVRAKRIDILNMPLIYATFSDIEELRNLFNIIDK